MSASVTACLIIIGNEILSGRTQDANLQFLAKRLNQRGIKLAEARIIPDIESVIVNTVNEMRAAHNYVFTTGGIGPTHDDITVDCVAKAFGLPVVVHPDAKAILAAHYKERNQEFTEARLRMARIPEGASLIENPVSKAPGIKIENVHIMAGVPKIMQAQFDHVVDDLEGGIPVASITVSAFLPESIIAPGLGRIQEEHLDVDVGSYPFYQGQTYGTSLVARGTDEAELDVIADKMRQMVTDLKGTWVDGDVSDKTTPSA